MISSTLLELIGNSQANRSTKLVIAIYNCVVFIGNIFDVKRHFSVVINAIVGC